MQRKLLSECEAEGLSLRTTFEEWHYEAFAKYSDLERSYLKVFAAFLEKLLSFRKRAELFTKSGE